MSDATTHFMSAIDSAYSAGIADGLRKAEILARIHAEHSPGYFESLKTPGITTPAKATKAAKASKASTIARGVKRAAKPREKGVKDGIISYMQLTGAGLSIGQIVERTGFKASSVRGTLMQMKKKGAVSCQGRGADTLWSLVTPKSGDGASDEMRA
jgi:hypothetical protein